MSGANIYTGGLIGGEPVFTSGVWGVGMKGMTYTDFLDPVLQYGPTLWLDASDTSTITEVAGAVSQWSDKSGNGFNMTQPTAASQPSTGVATIGGLNALSFDGSADYLRNTSNLLLVDGTDGTFSVFAVVKNDTLSGTDNVLYQDSGSPRMPQFLRTSVATPQSVVFTTTTVVTDNGPNMSTGTDTLLSIVCTTTSVEVWMNQTTNGSSALSGTLHTTALPVGVGGRDTGPDPWDGLIGEIIVIPYNVTAGQQADIETYLKDKWSL